MSSVTFPTSLGGDGSTVTDDSNAITGLDDGGHITRFVPALAQTVVMASTAATKAGIASAASTAALAAQTAAEAAKAGAIAISLAVPSGMPALRPALLLDLALTHTLDPRIAFSRASTATYTDKAGNLVLAAVGQPCFDYDPVTRKCLGLTIRESRTNLLLNATLNGANLATQSITTTAAQRTLSFYGTGTIVLSGTASATVIGTGAYPARTTYTYTPTAGTLTLTVTGTVQYAQDELGVKASSFIPTAGAAATRAADIVTLPLSGWFNDVEGSMVCSGDMDYVASGIQGLWRIDDGTDTNRIMSRAGGSGQLDFRIIAAGSSIVNLESGNVLSAGARFSHATAYKLDDYGGAFNGGNLLTDVSGAVPTGLTRILFGETVGNSTVFANGHLSYFAYYPKKLSNSELLMLSISA